MTASTSPCPTFAVVGHPNDGKTTLVASLAEIDSAEISPDPGTTKKCFPYPVKIDGTEVVRFIDTPGFEHPAKALEWFKEHEDADGSLAGRFVVEQADSDGFKEELEIMRPLAEGAAVIYVVDGSRPVGQAERAELEILRLVNRPRVAVINQKRDIGTHVEKWRDELLKTFNSVREFNAHHATFIDRLELLRAIRGIIQTWEPALDKVIATYELDWENRTYKSADAICDLLKTSMSCTEREEIRNRDATEKVRADRAAEDKLRDTIRCEEDRFREKVRAYFRHRRITGPPADSLLVANLFTKDVTRQFGLSKKRLANTGAAIGAALGFVVDLHAGLLTLMLGTAVGAATGYVVGWFGGNRTVKLNVQLMPDRLKQIIPEKVQFGIPLGGQERCAEARARPTSNLPWELIGRATEYFRWASTWPHGRCDEPLRADDKKQIKHPWLPDNWSTEDRATAADFIALAFGSSLGADIRTRLRDFFALKKKKDPESIEREMREMLVRILKEMEGFKT